MKNKIKIRLALTGLLLISPPVAYRLSKFYVTGYDHIVHEIKLMRNHALSSFNLKIIKESSIDYLIKEYSTLYDLNPLLVKAVIQQESNFNPNAYSKAGAIGLMQIMPENAKRCGLEKTFELWFEENNIKCGCQILAEELKVYKGDLHKALQVYNGGTRNLGIQAVVKYANEVIAKFAQLSYKVSV